MMAGYPVPGGCVCGPPPQCRTTPLSQGLVPCSSVPSFHAPPVPVRRSPRSSMGFSSLLSSRSTSPQQSPVVRQLSAPSLRPGPAPQRQVSMGTPEAVVLTRVSPRFVTRCGPPPSSRSSVHRIVSVSGTQSKSPPNTSISTACTEGEQESGVTLWRPPERPKPSTCAPSSRFDALYCDSKHRRARMAMIVANKQRQEEKEFQRRQRKSSSISSKSLDFQQWGSKYDAAIEQRRQRQQERAVRRLLQHKEAQEEELRECSFRPALHPDQGARRRVAQNRLKLRELGRKLDAKQGALMKELDKHHQEEQECITRLKRELSAELPRALGHIRTELETFLASDEGRPAWEERAQAYKEANPGLGTPRAREEARSDIVVCNETNLRNAVVAGFEDRKAVELRQIQISRLQILQQLEDLELQWTDSTASVAVHDLPKVMFQTGLVASLKQETWYLSGLEPVPEVPRVQQDVASPAPSRQSQVMPGVVPAYAAPSSLMSSAPSPSPIGSRREPESSPLSAAGAGAR